MAASASSGTVDVVPVIENQRTGRFWAGLLVLCWLITFIDGFDFQVISFAARYIKRAVHLTDTQLGTLGSVGLVGTLIGGLTLGFIGDRIGRRPSIIAGVAGFGVFMILFSLGRDYTQLLVLRFISGLFLGGVLPLTWALVTEFSPTRLRSTSVVIIMIGYSLGAAAGGPLSNLLIPGHGWQSVYLTGGVISLGILIPVVPLLPESVKFLAQKGLRPERTAAILRRVEPGAVFSPDAHFVVGSTHVDRGQFTPLDLFRGRLAQITPLIWVAYICSSAVIYFLAFWGPILNERFGFSVSAAATIAAVMAVAGGVGQLLIGRFVDTRGAVTLAAMPLIALPLLLLSGLTPITPTIYLVVLFAGHICITGGHGGMHSISGIFYRPGIRANGAAWATSIAKLGAMLGPWLAGVVMDATHAARPTFYVFAVFPLVMGVLLFVLGRVQRRLPADADGALVPEGADEAAAVPIQPAR